jgi:hypothetical protein
MTNPDGDRYTTRDRAFPPVMKTSGTPALALVACLTFILPVDTVHAGQAPTSSSAPATQPTAAESAQAKAQPAAQTPVTPSAQPPAPKPPRPPVVNRLNEVLPTWLRVRAEQRSRYEGFDGAGFTSGRDDAYYLNRLRLSATVQPSSSFSFTTQVQDARVVDKSVGPTGPPFRDEIDLRLAYAQIGSAKARVTTTLGRQELVFGDQRLIGHLNWTNTARSFDGARVTIRSRPFTLDVFATSVVALDQSEFNESDFDSSQFYGVYGGTTTLVPRAVVEPYVLFRVGRDLRSERNLPGDLKAATIGVRFVGGLPAGLDYNTEVAAQVGSLGADDVRAWAGHWQLRKTIPQARGLRVFGEYNTASGDENPTDGTRGTFDQLYPTGHDKYGLADQVGWRNIHHVRAGGEVLVRKGLVAGAGYHSWWLASRRDALYNAAGAVVARVAAGAESGHVGQELDVQATYTVSPQLQVSGGYAYIFPGAFLKEATPGASFSSPFVMVTYVFLAEK